MTNIYHITHINNLLSIIQSGQLLCDAEIIRQNVDHLGIAHQHIKNRRSARTVPVAAQGTLAHYVPFYFAPRSPMLYTIHRGNVEGYRGGQNDIVHLVASAERIVADKLAFAFTDGHADVAISRFFDDLLELDQIDWDLMASRYWYDTLQFPDRKRRKHAEFLVYLNLSWEYIDEMGVRLKTTARQVIQILDQSGTGHPPRVTVYPEWYY